jgi:8-oxo-dGTP diphosphatase
MSDSKNSQPMIGVGVLVWREKQLLLGKRINPGSKSCWQFPGGHLEPGESISDCARREVMEETGLKVQSLRHLGFTDKPFSVGDRQYITLLVSCDYAAGEAQTLEPDKCAGWSWFDYQHLPAPLFEPIKIFLAQQSGALQFNSHRHDLYALHRASHLINDIPSDEYE